MSRQSSIAPIKHYVHTHLIISCTKRRHGTTAAIPAVVKSVNHVTAPSPAVVTGGADCVKLQNDENEPAFAHFLATSWLYSDSGHDEPGPEEQDGTAVREVSAISQEGARRRDLR
jgi:hypothetical protein